MATLVERAPGKSPTEDPSARLPCHQSSEMVCTEIIISPSLKDSSLSSVAAYLGTALNEKTGTAGQKNIRTNTLQLRRGHFQAELFETVNTLRTAQRCKFTNKQALGHLAVRHVELRRWKRPKRPLSP